LGSIAGGLSVFARFARAVVDALAVVHFDFDRLITAVAADIEALVVVDVKMQGRRRRDWPFRRSSYFAN
jgi:hypothetical protein